jgi:hypothetical protein
MIDQDLKQLLQRLIETQQSLAEAQKETDRQIKETDREIEEIGRQLEKQAVGRERELEELGRRLEKQTGSTDLEIKELGKQIGGLGNNLGGFTEGLALPSMSRILEERFGAETIAARVKARRGADKLEIDVLAYANSDLNTAHVVEVKSRLRERDLKQVLSILERFPEFFPEHADKRVFGIVATVDVSEEERQRVLEKGLYLASIEDDLFKMETPPGFKARVFGGRAGEPSRSAR